MSLLAREAASSLAVALWTPASHLPCLTSIPLLFNVCAFVSSPPFLMNSGTKKQKRQNLVQVVGLVPDPLRQAAEAAWRLLAVS